MLNRSRPKIYWNAYLEWQRDFEVDLESYLELVWKIAVVENGEDQNKVPGF
jgi:hypothetical protein